MTTNTNETLEPAFERRRKPTLRDRAPLIALFGITLAGIIVVLYGVFVAPETEELLSQASHDRAAAACHKTWAELRTFPKLTTAAPADRAALLERENIVFTKLADAFAQLKTPQNDGAIALRGWVQDWRGVNASRAAYARALRTSPKFPELLLPKDDQGAPVTNRMNQYSRTHELIGCATHNLQAEITDGERRYPDDPTKVP